MTFLTDFSICVFPDVSIIFAKNVLWNSTKKAHDVTFAILRLTALSALHENSLHEQKWKKRREQQRQARARVKIDKIKIIICIFPQ